MATSPKWGIPYIAEGQAAPEVTHNTAINMLQMLAGGVLSRGNTPAVSPDEGAVYTVGSVPTGAWVGHANALAGWFGGAWLFVPGFDNDGAVIAMGAEHAGFAVYNDGASGFEAWDGAAWGAA